MAVKIAIGVLVVMIILMILMFWYVSTHFLQRNSVREAYAGINQDSSSQKQTPSDIYEKDFDTKSFIAVDEFLDFAFSVSPFNYRAIIECSSISYDLKSDAEREFIEVGFQNMLNNLDYPIVLYVQTRLVDNTKVMQKLRANAEIAIAKFPELEEYAKRYLDEMDDLSVNIGFPKCKKKYIIVPYEIDTDMSLLDDKEKEEFCLSELYTRASIICTQLHQIGVATQILPREEIAKVIYAAFNRNGFLLVEDIMRGNLNRLKIEGKNYNEIFSPVGMLESILYATTERINKELIDVSDNQEEKEMFQAVCNAITIIRKRIDLDKVSLDELLDKIKEMAIDVELNAELAQMNVEQNNGKVGE